MRLLLDEIFPPAVAAGLRARGHDVIAVAERPDLTGLSDGDLLDRAVRDRRVVVTENVRDFALLDGRYREQGRGHEGLAFVLKEQLPRGRAQLVGALVRVLDAELTDPGRPSARGFLAWPAASSPG